MARSVHAADMLTVAATTTELDLYEYVLPILPIIVLQVEGHDLNYCCTTVIYHGVVCTIMVQSNDTTINTSTTTMILL